MLLTDEHLREYFEDILGETTELARFIGRVENGKIIGVAAVFNFDGHTCEVGWAGDRGWITRGFMILLTDYIYRQLGCVRCTSLIEAKNEHAVKQAEKIGFVLEGCIREGAPSGDVLVYGMLEKEFRYGRFTGRR